MEREMTNTIMDTGNVSEILDLGPDDEISNMVATEEATGKGIEFHVSMQGHTFRDMEELIVQAAAQMIVGRHSSNELAKKIEAKCIELTAARVNEKLSSVTAEIVDQPLIPAGYGKESKPVTMREFIGLTGREYLMERVDSSGNKSTSSYGHNETRMEYIVSRMMAGKFKSEIEAATNAVMREVRQDVEARHKALLAAEKQRLADALAKLTAA